MEKKLQKNISYILHFIDSARFMQAHYPILSNNLSERIHKIKCKYVHDDKKCGTCGFSYKVCDCFLEYINFKDDLKNTNVYVVTKIINKNSMKC